MLSVELERVRCIGLTHPAGAASPLRAAAEALLRGRDDDLVRIGLSIYYGEFAPATAARVLGLHVDHELADYPPMAAVLPWEEEEPAQRLLAVEESLRGRRLWGLGDLGVTDGSARYGPASRRMVLREVHVLNALGLALRDGTTKCPPLVGTVVEDDRSGDWVFDVSSGLHRCAVLAALGRDRADARAVGGTVRRSESSVWHHVQTGLFTEDEALGVFDRYVDGSL